MYILADRKCVQLPCTFFKAASVYSEAERTQIDTVDGERRKKAQT